MSLTKLFPIVLMSVGLSSAFQLSPTPPVVNGGYTVSGVAFSENAKYTFENGLPNGLHLVTWKTGEHWQGDATNVQFNNGYLELWVPGGQVVPVDGLFSGGQVETDQNNIRHGSFRTVAILTQTPGVCNGIFTYQSDSQEIDIEWLSDINNDSSAGREVIWFTNQAVNGVLADKTAIPQPLVSSPFEEHEYRIDWFEDRVEWYVDAVKVAETTDNVPWMGSHFIVNNWSDGRSGWTAGPPADDAVFKIKSIDMYYNLA